MDETMDDAMTEQDDNSHILPLANDERRVLELYDRLQQLQLEISILRAQSKPQKARSEDSSEAIKKAQEELLEARARYKLRNDAVELVLTANPVLKAVHNGTSASPIERDLLPHVLQRDEAVIAATKVTSETQQLRSAMNEVQAETMRVCRINIDLTSQLFDLANEMKSKRTINADNSQVRGRVKELEDKLKASRRRWRVMKGVASGVVAGSGVDWARDETLRDIVLDPENED